MTYTSDFTPHPVPGTDWVVCTSPRSEAVVVAVDLPDYATPQLADAWGASIAARLNGRCPLCDAVATVHPEMKTAPPDVAILSFRESVTHTADCPATEENREVLERACSPDGSRFEPLVSPETIDALGDYIAGVVVAIRQIYNEETPC